MSCHGASTRARRGFGGDLMRWLITLITPPGGVVLDPFMGSGSICRVFVASVYGDEVPDP